MIGRWLRIGWKKNLVVGQINTCQFGGRGEISANQLCPNKPNNACAHIFQSAEGSA
jgi:hypothetical protein